MANSHPYPPSSLEGILAEMVISALAWEEKQKPRVKQPHGKEGLTDKARRIHCLPPDQIIGKETTGSEEEDGGSRPENASPVDLRRT
jgi:hypothetical protein